MSLVVTAVFPYGTYDGATSDPRRPEWPPAPARLLSALRAGAFDDADLDALRWLETQAPPVIHAGAPAARHHSETFVVTNARANKDGSGFHPGRTNGVRERVALSPSEPGVSFEWLEASPSSDLLDRLDDLASRLPYLGRSTSPVLVSVGTHLISHEHRYEPTEFGLADLHLPVPYAGMVQALDDAFASGARSWEVYRTRPYALTDSEAVDTAPASRLDPTSGPFDGIVTMRFGAGLFLAPNLLGRLTMSLRRAVLATMPDPLPAALTGHDADGTPHVAFVGLPNVGHQHADGRILGIGVVIPRSLPDTDRERLIDYTSGGRGMTHLQVPGIGHLDLERPGRQAGLSEYRWARATRRWISATPLVADNFPRRRSVADVIADSCVTAGYPRPAWVETSEAPLLPGAQRYRRRQLPMKGDDRRPYCHAVVEFDEPVTGPLLVGALRYLGFGLFAPAPESQEAPDVVV